MKKKYLLRLFLVFIIVIFSEICQPIFSQISTWSPAYNDNGYANPCSITIGDTIKFHISTTQTSYNIVIYKLGLTEKIIATFNNVAGGHRTLPDSAWEKGCGWPVSFSFKIPDTWESGAYAARFPVDTGKGMSTILFFVKEKNLGSKADVVVIMPYFNWVAYNPYGGKNVYDENSTNLQRAHKVSFNRPFFNGGYAEFRAYPYKMIQWLENNSIKYEVGTEMDIHKMADFLSHYKVVIGVGHAEYWTREERTNVDKYVKQGGKYLSLSGNTCWWQVRIEDNNNALVVYKDRTLDPLYGKVDSMVTVNWYDKPLNLPENLFLGASFRNAGYVADVNHTDFTYAQGYGGYRTQYSQHWVFNNTGLSDGDIFGRDPKDSLGIIVGYETDGALFKWNNGLPVALGTDGTPLNFRILGISPAVGQGDTIENRHATMGIYCNKNGGALFNSSSIYWAYGLPKDKTVQTITKNIITKFLSNRFPPDVTGWSPFTLVKDTSNGEIIQINKRECKALVGDAVKFSVKAEDPYNEKVKYSWYVDGIMMGMDSIFTYYPYKEGTSIITANVFNSKDTLTLNWKLKISIPMAIKPEKIITYKYDLEQNYPNPFNPSTTIRYSLAAESKVKLIIYNAIGQVMAVLVDRTEKAGDYEVKWEAGNASSGIYFYSVEASSNNGKDNFKSVKKMIYLR